MASNEFIRTYQHCNTLELTMLRHHHLNPLEHHHQWLPPISHPKKKVSKDMTLEGLGSNLQWFFLIDFFAFLALLRVLQAATPPPQLGTKPQGAPARKMNGNEKRFNYSDNPKLIQTIPSMKVIRAQCTAKVSPTTHQFQPTTTYWIHDLKKNNKKTTSVYNFAFGIVLYTDWIQLQHV